MPQWWWDIELFKAIASCLNRWVGSHWPGPGGCLIIRPQHKNILHLICIPKKHVYIIKLSVIKLLN